MGNGGLGGVAVADSVTALSHYESVFYGSPRTVQCKALRSANFPTSAYSECTGSLPT